MLEDETAEVKIELPQFVYGGFDVGDTAGTITVTVNGQPVKTVDLVYTQGSRRIEPKGNLILEKLKEIVEKYLHSFDLGTE
jgi:hypothetical protein